MNIASLTWSHVKGWVLILGVILMFWVVAIVEGKTDLNDVVLSITVVGETYEVLPNEMGFFSLEGQRDLGFDALQAENYVYDHWELTRPQSAYFASVNGALSIVPDQAGQDVDLADFFADVQADWPVLAEGYTIDSAPVLVMTADQLASRQSQVEWLLTEGFSFEFLEFEWTWVPQLTDLEFQVVGDEVMMRFDDHALSTQLAAWSDYYSMAPSDLRLLEVDPTETAYAVTEGDLTAGYNLLIDENLEPIQARLDAGEVTAELVYEELMPQIVNETDLDFGELAYLGEGQSFFDRSDPGREANIRNGLDNFYNDIVIPPGAEFSFNSFLGDISRSNGWYMASVIYNGEIEPQLGGGLCQVSTTVYRAGLDAGLEIVDRRGHSLYVYYYEELGNGLDATIYPGEQDLVFANNTDHYLLMRSYTDGDFGHVKFYGHDDGRKVTYEGPYTNTNQTEEIEEELGGLRYYQIAWKYRIEWPDGTVQADWIVSSYKSKVKQYDPEDVVTHPTLSW